MLIKCQYRYCEVMIPQRKVKGRQPLFCCLDHGKKERYLRNRKEILARAKDRNASKVQCANCDIIFIPDRWQKAMTTRGHKVYHSIECRDSASRISNRERSRAYTRAKRAKKSKTIDSRIPKKSEARIFASLNCINYRACTDKIKNGFKMPCHKCEEKIIRIGAFRDELSEHHPCIEESHVNWPSVWRNE
jgi:hypothetical protein